MFTLFSILEKHQLLFDLFPGSHWLIVEKAYFFFVFLMKNLFWQYFVPLQRIFK